MKIETVGDLHAFTQEELVARFGKWGTRLWELARGIDESPVEPSRPRKSWSSESTFPKDIPIDDVAKWIESEARNLWDALQAKGMFGRTVTVKLRTGDFRTATRQMTPETMPASAEDLARIGVELLTRFSFAADAKYRLAGIGVSNFAEEEGEPSLFEASTMPPP